jgi:hypothetical protein
MPPTRKQELPKVSSDSTFPLGRYKNIKVLWLIQNIESDDKEAFTKLGMMQESFFFPLVRECARKLQVRVDRDDPLKLLWKMKRHNYKDLCKTCKGREHQNSRGDKSCFECKRIIKLLGKAAQHRCHIAKICPESKTKVNTAEQREDIVNTWKNLAGPFMMCTDIKTSRNQIREREWLFDESFAVLFYTEGPKNCPDRIDTIYDLFFKNFHYLNKMAVKVAFRNEMMTMIEQFLEKNPSIKVYPKEPYRDEEIEKIEALANTVSLKFYKATKIRNHLQYDYTMEPKLCSKLMNTMIDLLERLMKRSSKQFFTESKKLFTGVSNI